MLERIELHLDLLAQQGPQVFPVPRLVRIEDVDFFGLAGQEPVDSVWPLRNPDQRDVFVPAALHYRGERIADLMSCAIAVDFLDHKTTVPKRVNKIANSFDLRIRLYRPIDHPELLAIDLPPKFQALLKFLGAENYAVCVFAHCVEYHKSRLVFGQLAGKIRFAAAALAKNQDDLFFGHRFVLL